MQRQRHFLYVQCDVHCPPQLLAKVCYDRGITLEVVYSYYPSIFRLINPLKYDGIIVGGGSMGSYEEETHSWLVPCKLFLSNAIHHNIPVLGLCLGCQILADVAGGKTFLGANGPEWGFLEWTYLDTAENEKDELFQLVRKNKLHEAMVLSHGDTFTLPQQMKLHYCQRKDEYSDFEENDCTLKVSLFAVSKEKQYAMMFRVGKYHYGIQPHPEADAYLYENFLKFGWAKLVKNGADGAALVKDALQRKDAMVECGKQVFNKWIDLCMDAMKERKFVNSRL